MSHLSSEQLQTLRTRLLQEQRELEARRDEAAANTEEESGELSSYDNHPGDLGTITSEKARDLAIDQSLETQLERVETALQRMDEGTYGLCEISGEPIPYERLEALPSATRTVEHAESPAIEERRPPEEEVMTRPPASEQERPDEGKFDDAGAWETLERYGNAE